MRGGLDFDFGIEILPRKEAASAVEWGENWLFSDWFGTFNAAFFP